MKMSPKFKVFVNEFLPFPAHLFGATTGRSEPTARILLQPGRIQCLLFVVMLLCTGRAVGQSDTLTALKDYPSAQKAFDSRMARARRALARYRDANREAHLIVGRVELEGHDPETVVSQMVVVEEGFFVDVIASLDRPIGFRCHQYKPVDFVVPKDAIPAEDGVIDVGIVKLSRASSSRMGKITGKLSLEGGGDPSEVSVTLSISNARVNTPSGGTEGIGRRYQRLSGTVTSDGTISFEALSEGNYYVSFSHKGYVGTFRGMTVSVGETSDMGEMTLELPRRIDLNYIVAKHPQKVFDATAQQSIAFAAGHRWKSRPDIYGWDLEFAQSDGKIQFKHSYGPCVLQDLGEGTLEDFIDVPFEVDQISPRAVPVVSGHVYLLHQGHWNHHVLFRMEVGEAIPPDAERPSGIPVRPGRPLLKDVIAHYQFDGDAEEWNGTGGAFELKNTRFDNDALYLNGKYENSVKGGYKAICRTPRQNYAEFTLALRFKAESFGPRNHNIITGGSSYRWFGVKRDNEGRLAVSFNNGRLVHSFTDLELETGSWHTVLCAVSIPRNSVTVTLDDKASETFHIPADFQLDVIGSSAEDRDKVWTFTNYASGDSFHGLVDELTILKGSLSNDEIEKTMALLKKP